MTTVAKDWKKLARRITEDRYLTELFDAYPRAEGVFYRMIAAADDYGRLPADTPLLRAKICPRSSLPDKKITTEVNRLVNSGKVTRYTVRDEEYLAIVNYHRYQETDWSKTGKPEYPAPPDWEPPAELVSFVESHATTGKFPWSRYGVNEPQRTSENLSAPQTGEVQHRSLREIEIEMEIEREGDAPTGAGTPSGSEKKERVREKITAPPPADEEDAGWDRNGFRNDCAIYAQEAPWLQEAVGAAQKGFRGQTLTRWAGTLHYLLLQNPKITGAKVVEWLQADPPDDSTNPKWWWGARKREEAKVDRADPTPEDPAEASARIYRETPWAFKTPEAIAVQVGQWEQLLFDTFGKPENAEVERQYHAAWREYQATGDAEAFPLPPEGLGVPT